MTNLTRRSLLRATGVLAAGAGLAACTGEAGASRAKATHRLDASHPWGGDPATEGTPVRGGTLRVGMDREARAFDPTIQGVNESASAVYDSLLKFDHNGDPQPYLAKSMTTPDGGRTWILTLRPGVLFHDGTPLDAEAVIFNVQRHIHSAASPCRAYVEPIASMSAPDATTVRFTLQRPVGSFSSAFALPWTVGNLGAIASPRAVRQYGQDYTSHPVGAGPYRFVEWIPNSHITLARYDRYWQKDLPRLDGITFRPLSDTDSRYASVANGDVDLIFAGYFTEIYRASANKNLVTYYGPGAGAEMLHPNHTKAPFNDHRMREALIRAIDPNALSATQFEGVMVRADTAFPSNSPYYSDPAAQSYPSYDPKKARALVAAYTAGGGDPSFTLDAPNSPDRMLLATFLQAQWAAAGLKAQLRFSDLAQFSSTVVLAGTAQLVTNVSGPWDSPYPYMYNMFHSGGNLNYGRYANPQMDSVLERAVATTDPAIRVAAYQQAQVIANKDLAVVWDSRPNLGTITRRNVRGIVRYLVRDAFWATAWLAR